MRKLNQKGFIEEAVAIAVIVVVLACSVMGIIAFVDWNNKHNSDRGRGDAPTGKVNTEARDVYQMPDRFSNVAMFCDKYGNSVYMTTQSTDAKTLFALKDGCQD